MTGKGDFVINLALPNMGHGYVLRSPHAHARIVSIDTTSARAAPGLLCVLTGDDVVADNIKGIPCQGFPALPAGAAITIAALARC